MRFKINNKPHHSVISCTEGELLNQGQSYKRTRRSSRETEQLLPGLAVALTITRLLSLVLIYWRNMSD